MKKVDVHVVPTINTESGLDQAAARYTGDRALQRDSLRWSPADWPLHGQPADAFSAWHVVWQPFAGPRTLSRGLHEALRRLDERGLFGAEREDLILGVFMGDQSDAARLKSVKALNPPQAVARFKEQQRAARRAWKALAEQG